MLFKCFNKKIIKHTVKIFKIKVSFQFRNKGLTSGGNKYFEFDCPSPGATSTGGFQDYCGGLPMDPFSNPKPFPNGATLCKWRPGWTPPPDKRA